MSESEGAKKPDIKKIGKAAANTAAGAGIAASLLVGSVFGSPAEIVTNEDSSQPAAIVQTMAEDPVYDDYALSEEPSEEKRTFKDKLRDLLLRMPVWLRAALLVPLWAVGYGLIHLVTFVASLTRLPVIGTVIKFLLGAAAILALVIVGLKLLSPDVPLKTLLGKRNMIPLAVCVGIIALAGSLAGLLWPGKAWITPLVDVCAGGLYLAYFCLFVRKRQTKEA